MNSIATRARHAAVNFEAKKTGFGQAQDGWSLTLRIQDNDVPDGVAKAKKGTRYQVALVEIGDDEQPVIQPRPSNVVVPASADGADKERRKFDELPIAQQAGILCNSEAFQRFLRETFPRNWRDSYAFKLAGEWSVDEAAAWTVRDLCGVESRAHIKPESTEWLSLMLAYKLWNKEAEVVPS